MRQLKRFAVAGLFTSRNSQRNYRKNPLMKSTGSGTDINTITSICEMEGQSIKTITEKEVCNALRKLKNSKAMDPFGLISEHFK